MTTYNIDMQQASKHFPNTFKVERFHKAHLDMGNVPSASRAAAGGIGSEFVGDFNNRQRERSTFERYARAGGVRYFLNPRGCRGCRSERPYCKATIRRLQSSELGWAL